MPVRAPDRGLVLRMSVELVTRWDTLLVAEP